MGGEKARPLVVKVPFKALSSDCPLIGNTKQGPMIFEI